MMKKNNNSSFANEFDLDKGYPLQLLSINYSNNDFFLNPKFSQVSSKPLFFKIIIIIFSDLQKR